MNTSFQQFMRDCIGPFSFMQVFIKNGANNGEEEMVYIRDHHEAIIDRETWEATQKELERRSPSAFLSVCTISNTCRIAAFRIFSLTSRLLHPITLPALSTFTTPCRVAD